MKFYRRLKKVSALSFDLDDTLYSNRPVMVRAEQQMLRYFAETLAMPIAGERDFWRSFRQQALASEPRLIHDVSALRLQSYVLAISALGHSEEQATAQAEKAMQYFHQKRNDFSVPPAIHTLLSTLSQQLPLVAITNGNVNVAQLGLAEHFQFIYHPGMGYRSKPFTDMFHTACADLDIEPHELLHLGDCGNADIYGALRAGCQAAWLPQYRAGKPLSILPHVQLARIEDVTHLIG